MRILIADDESIIRMGLKSMLETLGHEVILARDGREALRRVREYQLDMVILDIKMPLTDGLQAAQAIHRFRPLPVVLLTAYSDRELVAQAAELPIHGYLVKPVKQEALNAAIVVAERRFAELQTLQAERDRLAQTLEGRKLVDRAKGKLMDEGLSEEEAYRMLRDRARRARTSVQQVALALLRE